MKHLKSQEKGIIAALTAVLIPTFLILIQVNIMLAESYYEKMRVERCTDLVARSLVLFDTNDDNLEQLTHALVALNCPQATPVSLVYNQNAVPPQNAQNPESITLPSQKILTLTLTCQYFVNGILPSTIITSSTVMRFTSNNLNIAVLIK